MHRAQESAWTAAPPSRLEPPPAPVCASCGGSFDLRAYGAALFCADCREMSAEFYRKDLYCDLGGGD
jgi:hypothetical protein